MARYRARPENIFEEHHSPDIRNYFGGQLELRIWFGTPNTCAEVDKTDTIGSSWKNLKSDLDSLDPESPETLKAVYLSSTATFATRAMFDPDKAELAPGATDEPPENRSEAE